MEERQKAKDALQGKDMEITNLKAKAKAEYKNRLNIAKREVEFHKDLKSKMSTKKVTSRYFFVQ